MLNSADLKGCIATGSSQKSGWSFRSNHDIIARFISQEDAIQ